MNQWTIGQSDAVIWDFDGMRRSWSPIAITFDMCYTCPCLLYVLQYIRGAKCGLQVEICIPSACSMVLSALYLTQFHGKDSVFTLLRTLSIYPINNSCISAKGHSQWGPAFCKPTHSTPESGTSPIITQIVLHHVIMTHVIFVILSHRLATS